MKVKLLVLAGLLAAGVSGELLAEKIPSNANPIVLVKNDPATIIANYIKALGGEDKIKSINNVTMTAEANFQGQKIEIKTISDSENKRLMQSTSVGGNVIQKTLLSDGKGKMIVMGQAQDLPETTAAMLASQTYLTPELYYDEMGFKAVYIGIEDLDSVQVHRLEVSSPSGIITNEFYSVENGLKLKSSSGDAGDVIYSDYQEVDGIMFPMHLTIKNPMLPVALEGKVLSVKFNQTLSETDFQ